MTTVFVPAPPLSDADVQRIVETAAHRLVRLLQQRGILAEAEGDILAEKEPLMIGGAETESLVQALGVGPGLGFQRGPAIARRLRVGDRAHDQRIN